MDASVRCSINEEYSISVGAFNILNGFNQAHCDDKIMFRLNKIDGSVWLLGSITKALHLLEPMSVPVLRHRQISKQLLGCARGGQDAHRKGAAVRASARGKIIHPNAAWNLFGIDVLRSLLARQITLLLPCSFNPLRLAVEPMAVLHATLSGIAAIAAGYARMEATERGDDDAREAVSAFHVLSFPEPSLRAIRGYCVDCVADFDRVYQSVQGPQGKPART